MATSPPALPPTTAASRSLASTLKRYTVRQRPSPGKVELRVEGAQGQQVFRIIRRPSHPPRYLLIPTSDEETQLLVRPMKIPIANRYTLTQEETTLLTLQRILTVEGYRLRDGQRRLLGRFVPVNPSLTILRTPTTITARIRLLPAPPPLRVHALCDVAPQHPWLLATLLYLIALIDEAVRGASPPGGADPMFER